MILFHLDMKGLQFLMEAPVKAVVLDLLMY
jgi:hypothetical protein